MIYSLRIPALCHNLSLSLRTIASPIQVIVFFTNMQFSLRLVFACCMAFLVASAIANPMVEGVQVLTQSLAYIPRQTILTFIVSPSSVKPPPPQASQLARSPPQCPQSHPQPLLPPHLHHNPPPTLPLPQLLLEPLFHLAIHQGALLDLPALVTLAVSAPSRPRTLDLLLLKVCCWHLVHLAGHKLRSC